MTRTCIYTTGVATPRLFHSDLIYTAITDTEYMRTRTPNRYLINIPRLESSSAFITRNKFGGKTSLAREFNDFLTITLHLHFSSLGSRKIQRAAGAIISSNLLTHLLPS